VAIRFKNLAVLASETCKLSAARPEFALRSENPLPASDRLQRTRRNFIGVEADYRFSSRSTT